MYPHFQQRPYLQTNVEDGSETASDVELNRQTGILIHRWMALKALVAAVENAVALMQTDDAVLLRGCKAFRDERLEDC